MTQQEMMRLVLLGKCWQRNGNASGGIYQLPKVEEKDWETLYLKRRTSNR